MTGSPLDIEELRTKIEKYFKTVTKEQLKKDWRECEKMTGSPLLDEPIWKKLIFILLMLWERIKEKFERG